LKNYYNILGVNKGSTTQEIEQAYESLSKRFDNELDSNDSFLVNYFNEVKGAFEVLANADRRREFDRVLRYSEIQEDMVALTKSNQDKAKQDLEKLRIREIEELQKKKQKLSSLEIELEKRQHEFENKKSEWSRDVELFKKDHSSRLEELEKLNNQQSENKYKAESIQSWLSRKKIIVITTILSIIIILSGAVYLFNKTDSPLQTESEIPTESESIVPDTIIQDTTETVKTESDNLSDSSFIAARMDTILDLYEEITNLEMKLTKIQTPCGFVSVRAKDGEVKIIGRSFNIQSTGTQLSQNYFLDKGELIYVFESYLDESGNKDQNRFYFLDSRLINTISSDNHNPINESREDQMIDISRYILKDFNEGRDLDDPECALSPSE
jgi:curved DNA-binding protein CbpA